MKKLLIVFAVLLCFAVGCGKPKESDIDEENSVIIVPSSSVLALDDDTTLEDYIMALKDLGEITFDGYYSNFGYFVTSMNGKANEETSSTENSSTGYSWALYLDFTTYDGVIYAGDSVILNYNGTKLYQASYGVSAIPCLENHTYAFVYEYYSYLW